VDLIENGEFGYMVAVKGNALAKVRLQDVAKGPRTVRSSDPLIASARAVGTCFGD
jgi:6-phosphofructokinase 1